MFEYKVIITESPKLVLFVNLPDCSFLDHIISETDQNNHKRS